MNKLKSVRVKIVDKFIKKGFFGGRNYFTVLQIVDERLKEKTFEQKTSVDSYYKVDIGDIVGIDLYKHSDDGLWYPYPEDED
jgi:hypothetical protein